MKALYSQLTSCKTCSVLNVANHPLGTSQRASKTRLIDTSQIQTQVNCLRLILNMANTEVAAADTATYTPRFELLVL